MLLLHAHPAVLGVSLKDWNIRYSHLLLMSGHAESSLAWHAHALQGRKSNGQLCVVFTGTKIFYNTLVALPMSLSLMSDRLEQKFYRQLEGWLGDVATIEANARAFNGDDSSVTEAAAGPHPYWKAGACHVVISC